MKSPDTIERRLHRLNALRRKKADVLREEATLIAHVLTDYTLLPGMYSHFGRIITTFPPSKQPDVRAQKKLFLFIALYLYCPQALAGGKVERGLNIHLAKAMNIPNHHNLTYHCEGLGMWYTQYPDFRQAIDYILTRICKHLKRT